jgi:hypothetical protein
MLRVSICLALLALASVAQADDKDTWREKLETVIPECIKLLEAKEYVKLLEAMVQPSELNKLKDREGGMEAFAEQFRKKKAGDLLKVLKDIKGRSPSMDENGSVAAYEVNVEGFSKKAIKFRKVDKFWYIIN